MDGLPIITFNQRLAVERGSSGQMAFAETEAGSADTPVRAQYLPAPRCPDAAHRAPVCLLRYLPGHLSFQRMSTRILTVVTGLRRPPAGAHSFCSVLMAAGQQAPQVRRPEPSDQRPFRVYRLAPVSCPKASSRVRSARTDTRPQVSRCRVQEPRLNPLHR